MTDEPLQMPLFASSGSSSSSAAPSSLPSSVRTTSSNARETSTQTDAETGTPSLRAPAPSARAGARGAEPSSAAASGTAASGQLPMPLAPTSTNTADPMFEIPRPRTRAECQQEARPCPWVGCKHHLLLEVAAKRPDAKHKTRATSLRLNRASSGRTQDGRRPGLRSSAAGVIVRNWIDEAVELLSYMPYTCSLDVVDDYPDGLSSRRIGWLFAVTEQMIDKESRKPHVIDALARLKEFMLR